MDSRVRGNDGVLAVNAARARRRLMAADQRGSGWRSDAV